MNEISGKEFYSSGNPLKVIQEPLPLKPRIRVNKSVVLVKREDGFTKTLFSLFFQVFCPGDGLRARVPE